MVKDRHILLFILWVVILNGCHSPKHLRINNICGVYRWKDLYGVTETMTLHPDQTFSFYWQHGLNSGVTHGNWQLKNHKIIFNSDRQPQSLPSHRITPVPQIKTEGFKIQINGMDGIRLPMANCVLFDKNNIAEASIADQGGIHQLAGVAGDRIFIQHVGYHHVNISLDTFKLNTFIIEIPEIETDYTYFVNEVWILKRNKVYRLQNSIQEERRYNRIKR